MAQYKKLRDFGETKKVDIHSNIPGNSTVINIVNGEHKKLLIQNNTIVCIDIWATWCQPCVKLAPAYDQLSSLYTEPGKCVFAKESVDLGLSPHVTAVPHFEIYKHGEKVHETNGGDLQEIENVIKHIL